MKKQIYLVILIIFSFGFVFAEDQIQLPEVTTTVTGETLGTDKNAVPDLIQYVPSLESVEAPLPVLPGAEISSLSVEPEADLTADTERSIYAEGLVGGGYPGYFIGNFSIYKNSGVNPFNLKFLHESTEGYGLHSASDGYFDSKTGLFGEKQIVFNKLKLNIGADYSTQKNGLESRSLDFFDATKQTVGVKQNAIWSLTDDFNLIFNISGNWYKRYFGHNGSSLTGTYPEKMKDLSIINLQPVLAFEFDKNSFATIFSAQYNLEKIPGNLESNSIDYKYYSINHRGEFGLKETWSKNFSKSSLSIGGDVAAVIGSMIGSSSVIIPFNLELNYSYQGETTSQPFVFSVNGGLYSDLTNYSETEEKFNYSYLYTLLPESTDWFTSAKVSIPIKSVFMLNAGADWRKTAFDNGIWEPQYNDSLKINGIYKFDTINRTLFKTDLGMSFVWKLLTVNVDWKSNWLYIPCDESRNRVGASFSVLSETGFWGTTFTLDESIGENTDQIPIISANCFMRVGNSLRLALDISDVIKLFTGEDRMYSSSNYLMHSGSVTFTIKYFF